MEKKFIPLSKQFEQAKLWVDEKGEIFDQKVMIFLEKADRFTNRYVVQPFKVAVNKYVAQQTKVIELLTPPALWMKEKSKIPINDFILIQGVIGL